MISVDVSRYIESLSDADLIAYIQVGTPAYTDEAVAFAQRQFELRAPTAERRAELEQALAARQAEEARMEEYGPDFGLGPTPPPRVNAARMLLYFGWSYMALVLVTGSILGTVGFFRDVAFWTVLFSCGLAAAAVDLICARNVRCGGRISVVVALLVGGLQTLLFVPILILLVLAWAGYSWNGYYSAALPVLAVLALVGVLFGFSLCHSLIRVMQRDAEKAKKGFPMEGIPPDEGDRISDHA